MSQGVRKDMARQCWGEKAALAKRATVSTLPRMSFTELEQQVRALSDAERLRLRNLLEQIRMENDAEWQREMARRNEAMNRGEKVTLEEMQQLHEDLLKQGR